MPTLYLIPTPISENRLDSLPTYIGERIGTLKYFVVERTRTARRFIRQVAPAVVIDDCRFHEIDKNNPLKGLHDFLSILLEGHDVGLMSEAGCPGVADPGILSVKWAHQHGIIVDPMVGPSSIIMALMASGMNGQNFAFNGYLPNKRPAILNTLKSLQRKVETAHQTQLFMDAPYRNGFLLEACIDSLPAHQHLCIACDIDSESQEIISKPIGQWSKDEGQRFHKRPAIFLIGR